MLETFKVNFKNLMKNKLSTTTNSNNAFDANNQSIALPSIFKRRVSSAEFRQKISLLKQWFKEFNDEQKNLVLKNFINECDQSQIHVLSMVMSHRMHQGCPANCQDPLTVLPEIVSAKILSYLDAPSLCKASLVNRKWHQLINSQHLWRDLCKASDWCLKRDDSSYPRVNHCDWKMLYIEKYRLQQNWLKGRCNVRTFEGHSQGVSCLQFDDTRIVSGSSDNTIKVWNIRTNSSWAVQTLVGHSVSSPFSYMSATIPLESIFLDFFCSMETLFCYENSLHWDSFKTCPGKVRCLHLDNSRLVSGSADLTIKVWDLSTRKNWASIACKVTMIGHTDTVRCLKADDVKVISGSYDKTIKIWNIKNGVCENTLRGHEGAVLCIHFDQNKIISGSSDLSIKVWSIDGRCMETLTGHTDAVTCLQFVDNKIISGSLDCTLRYWDLRSGTCVKVIDWMASEGHTRVIRCLQVDKCKVVSASDDKTIKVWSLETGKRLVTLKNHTDGVTCLQFNDNMIVSGSYDKTVKLWDFSCC